MTARALKKKGLLRRKHIEGYVFIMPWLLGFILWTAGPMIASLVIALHDWEIIIPAEYVGLDNFSEMLSDELFWKSLYNTGYYTFLAVPLRIVAAFILALLLNVDLRGIRAFRTIYYLPSLTPAVANAMIWLWIFNPEFGMLNALIDALSLPFHPLWIYDPVLSKPSFILMGLSGVGSAMIIFLAGLRGVPEDLYEAASIDGANTWNRFWKITLPMVTPMIWFNLIMQILASWQIFTAAFIMTDGRPLNTTLFYVLYLYHVGFDFLHMGYASALAWVLFVIILFFTLFQVKLADRWVYYEGELQGS